MEKWIEWWPRCCFETCCRNHCSPPPQEPPQLRQPKLSKTASLILLDLFWRPRPRRGWPASAHGGEAAAPVCFGGEMPKSHWALTVWRPPLTLAGPPAPLLRAARLTGTEGPRN